MPGCSHEGSVVRPGANEGWQPWPHSASRQQNREPFQASAGRSFQLIPWPQQQRFPRFGDLAGAVDAFLAPPLKGQPQHGVLTALYPAQIDLSLPFQMQHLQGAGLAPGHAAQEALGGRAKRAAMLP